jgi:hypothetical protein
MAYMTYQEQLEAHLNFLYKQGLKVNKLNTNAEYIRCRKIGELCGRGEHFYTTRAKLLDNRMLGLSTLCRGTHGEATYRTYGQFKTEEIFFFGSSYSDSMLPTPTLRTKNQEPVWSKEHLIKAQNARLLWLKAAKQGDSDYLTRKGVGAYNIRFIENQYGRVALVPMQDLVGMIWNIQFLNPIGTKRFLRNARCKGLFQILGNLVNGLPIGISESYVTAATCYELGEVPVVNTFSCVNFRNAINSLQRLYPHSPFIIFADNDRHLKRNTGVEHALQLQSVMNTRCKVAVPNFSGFSVSSEYTDWNDLMRVQGREMVHYYLQNLIKSMGFDYNHENQRRY